MRQVRTFYKGSSWKHCAPTPLLEAANCRILAIEPRFRRWSGDNAFSAPMLTMSKASGATMAELMQRQYSKLPTICNTDGGNKVQVCCWLTSGQMAYKRTDGLQMYRQLTSVQTAYKCTDGLQSYRWLTNVQTAYKCTDGLQVYRWLTNVQTAYKCPDGLQLYRQLKSVQMAYKCPDDLQVYRWLTGVKTVYKCTDSLQVCRQLTSVRRLTSVQMAHPLSTC